MALIKCSECGKEISDKAPACPNCGKPLKINEFGVQISTNQNNPIQVEPVLTSKKWKKVKLISWGIIVFGFIFPAFLSGSLDNRQTLGWIIVFLGVIVLIIGYIGAWYADRRTR